MKYKVLWEKAHWSVSKVRLYSSVPCKGCGRNMEHHQVFLTPDGVFCIRCFRKSFPNLWEAYCQERG